MPGNPADSNNWAGAWVVVLEDGKTVFFSTATRAAEFALEYQREHGEEVSMFRRKERL